MKIGQARQSVYDEMQSVINYLPDQEREKLQSCVNKLKCIDTDELDVLKELIARKSDNQDSVMNYYFDMLDILKELYEVE